MDSTNQTSNIVNGRVPLLNNCQQPAMPCPISLAETQKWLISWIRISRTPWAIHTFWSTAVMGVVLVTAEAEVGREALGSPFHFGCLRGGKRNVNTYDRGKYFQRNGKWSSYSLCISSGYIWSIPNARHDVRPCAWSVILTSVVDLICIMTETNVRDVDLFALLVFISLLLP